MDNCALVVTTINPPNDCLRQLAQGAAHNNIRFVIAGDTKSPEDFQLEGSLFLSIEEQKKRFPRMAKLLPLRHYARKNIAYLQAIEEGSMIILETDDDNFPLETFWKLPPETIPAEVVRHRTHWVNIYRLFSKEFIWPRGFPLEHLHGSEAIHSQGEQPLNTLVVQGLADENPDVDAIYRLSRPLPIHFEKRTPVAPDIGHWCPFNSQNTVFRKPVFQLLYLPSYCSFRMTDIWRSFIAQRCLWEMNKRLIFISHTVYQKRNKHNLMRDFADEVPGYLNNELIRKTLDELTLDAQDLGRSLILCYEALVEKDMLDAAELPLVKRWVEYFEELEH